MFDRVISLIGENNYLKIKNTCVLIVGLGGVGGYVVESLVRSGIENIILIDYDKIDITNLNRQIISNINNLNKTKTDITKERILSINPNCNVITHNIFLNNETINILNNYQIDYIIDACDTVNTKKLLIDYSIDNNIKLISSMGTANKIDPTKLEIMNIWKTQNDPVAKAMRKMLRDNDIKYKLPVLCSTEIPIKTHERTPGSVSFVPNVAGFCIASYVFNDIISYGSDLNE
jgi:tRNA A37 threonylcarbamoyladenosine dehydratase